MKPTPNQLISSEQYVSVKRVAAMFDISVATAWRWAAEGRIPKPIKLSPGCSRWALSGLQCREAK